MNEFWENIKKTREESGKTLKDISESTNINIKYFENIENGEFSFVDATYMRLFIKAYANEINADYDELIKNTPINDIKKTKSKISTINAKAKKVRKNINNKNLNITIKNNSNKLFQIIAIIAIISFTVVIITRIWQDNNDNKTQKNIEKTSTQELNNLNSTDSTNSETPADSVISNFNFPIHLNIFPNNNLVYRLGVKNNTPKEELIVKDVNHSITIDSSFNLIIYNASQCLLKINDKIIPINPNIENFEFSVNDSGYFSIK